jgi:hypothetical protein
MASIPLVFVETCQRYADYPKKLALQSRYGHSTLQMSHIRLGERLKHLRLFSGADKILIPYRHINREGVILKRNILSEDELGAYLGDESMTDPNGAIPDPQCRMLYVLYDLSFLPTVNHLAWTHLENAKLIKVSIVSFLYTESSARPLRLTLNCCLRMLSYFQVMPSILDFLYVYGAKRGEDPELRFSGFKAEKTLTNPDPDLTIPALNRSGLGFQMCYNLKSVWVKDKNETEGVIVNTSWKIRQAVIHHQFDLVKSTQLWILGDPRGSMHELMEHQFNEQSRENASKFESFSQSFKTSLDVHVTYARWAAEGWRWHVQWLEETIQRLVSSVAMAIRSYC